MQTPPADRSRKEIRAATLSLVIASVLLIFKFIAYLLTDSSAIFSDALESIVNVVAAALATYAIVLAHRPADAEHPYGHGKIEFMSAALEGGMMLLASFVMILRAIEQAYAGTSLNQSNLRIGMVILAIAMIINFVMGFYLVQSGKRGGSITLEADGKHLLADAMTSVGVLLALALVMTTGWKLVDPIAAILVALIVAFEAAKLLRRSTAGLMDEQDRADNLLLRKILDSHLGEDAKLPKVCSYHKLRHRHSGRYHWVDFHLMVPSDWNVEHGHQVASSIEYEIEKALGEGNATAHVEPCDDDQCDCRRA